MPTVTPAQYFQPLFERGTDAVKELYQKRQTPSTQSAKKFDSKLEISVIARAKQSPCQVDTKSEDRNIKSTIEGDVGFLPSST